MPGQKASPRFVVLQTELAHTPGKLSKLSLNLPHPEASHMTGAQEHKQPGQVQYRLQEMGMHLQNALPRDHDGMTYDESNWFSCFLRGSSTRAVSTLSYLFL